MGNSHKILSFNITKYISDKNTYILKNVTNEYPSLFYLNKNDEENITNVLMTNSQFNKYIHSEILNNISYYSYSTINIIMYDLEHNDTKSINYNIQMIYDMKTNELKELAYLYLYDILNELHNELNLNYKLNNELNEDLNDTLNEENNIKQNVVEDIRKLYDEIYQINNENISKETILKYVESKLQQKYELTQNNINFIIETFLKINIKKRDSF